MSDPLAPLIADGIVEEVISRLKTGKEAEIFLVQHAGEICAAKVYKDRQARSFRNNAAYKEGRSSRNTRTQRAMDTGTRFGQQAAEDAWKAKEFEALQKLYAAGVRVPKPYMLYEGVLLMEVVIDAEGHPSPRLIDAAIPRERAAEYYADLRQQVIRILRCDLIHGDLSPYNVLLAWNGPTLIDFPQVVGAAHNSQAAFFFQRDLQTLQRFFANLDPALNASAQDAQEIWRAYERGELTENFVPTGRFVESRRHKARKQKHRGRPSSDAPATHHAAPPAQSGVHAQRAGGGGQRSSQGGNPAQAAHAGHRVPQSHAAAQVTHRTPQGGSSPPATPGAHRPPGTPHPSGHGAHRPPRGAQPAHPGPGARGSPQGRAADPHRKPGHAREPKPREGSPRGRNARAAQPVRELKVPAVSFVPRPAQPVAAQASSTDRPTSEHVRAPGRDEPPST